MWTPCVKERGPCGQSGASHETTAFAPQSQPSNLSAYCPFPHRDFSEGRAAFVVSEKDSPL